MSSNIIKKCIEELQKPEFRKDYVLGLLEALDEQTTPTYPIVTANTAFAPSNIIQPSVGSDMPPRPLIIPAADPSLIAKLKGGATVEEVPVPLNAPKAS